MIKKCFLFLFKSSFRSQGINFLSQVFGSIEKWSQTGKQMVAKHILPNISKSKGNLTIKFGQLKEYSMTNIFLENFFAKCGEETIPRPFSKKS